MKRIQALLILLVLIAGPFLKAPVWHFCAMRPGVPQSACCCGQESPTGSGCCKLISVPSGEQLAGVAPGVSAPDITGIIAPVRAVVSCGVVFDQRVERSDHAPPRTTNLPLFLLHSSFLS